MSDNRTLRSRKLRNLLWIEADGKCKLCGCDLDPNNWHADHIVPWSKSHRTNVHEMQALCPSCNLKKGNNVEYTGVDIAKLRPGLKDGYNILLDGLRNQIRAQSDVEPTRYGKTDLIRAIAIDANVVHKLIPCTLVLSPNATLRKQVVKKEKLFAMSERYGIPWDYLQKMREMRVCEKRPHSNGEILLSSTIQLVQRNLDCFVPWVETLLHECGVGPLICIDECHMVGRKRPWGEAIKRLIDVGAFAILFTATEIREDDDKIPGFRYEIIDSTTATKYIIGESEYLNKRKIDVYSGHRDLVKIIADHKTTFKQAWSEIPCPICRLNREIIDVRVKEITGEDKSSDLLLSELPANKAAGVIAKASRDDRVISKCVSSLLLHLSQIRKICPDAAGIVFTGNDDTSESTKNDNYHAKKIVKEINRQMSQFGMNLTCRIASQKSEESADDILDAFIAEQNPSGDILLVKQMAGAGIDCGRLKVALDLSTVRTVSSTIQRLMRVATPYAGMNVAQVITLSDIKMQEIWHWFIEEPGGSWIDGEFSKSDSYEVPIDQKTVNHYVVKDVTQKGYDDSDGRCGDISLLPYVNELRNAIPELNKILTIPQMAERVKTMRCFYKQSDTCETDQQIIERLQNEIKIIAKEITDYKCRVSKDLNYKDISISVYSCAKSAAGVSRNTKLPAITNIQSLKKMRDYLADQKLSLGE